MVDNNYIFGYGSLVNFDQLKGYANLKDEDKDKIIYCNLLNYRRTWNVAMDNNRQIKGYKYYIEKDTGIRPNIKVCFLNIYESLGNSINGVVFPVNKEMLLELDKRERNYRRIDVTNLLDIKICGQVWAYIGLEEAYERYKCGKKNGNAVISSEYFDIVYNAFELLGEEGLRKYLRSTDNLNIPLKKIKVIKI